MEAITIQERANDAVSETRNWHSMGDAMDYIDQMTAISYDAFEAAIQPGTSPGEAATMLMSAVEIRRFPDVLRQFASEDDLRTLLVMGLCANDATRNPASIDKKARAWLGGKYQPTAREDLLELCFVLHLTAEQADAFLAMTGEKGLHWRDPRELVYGYALRKGMDYPEAKNLLTRVMPAGAGGEPPENFTPLIHREAADLDTEEELREYLARESGRLGSLHNGAYQQFMAMIQVLEAPKSYALQAEERYTMREIVEKYLDKKLPSAREGKKLEEKKRGILADWPDEVTLSRMKNRKLDVTRKVLILLFLATDGGEEPSQVNMDEDAEEFFDKDADFRSSLIRMNHMLNHCGYQKLDPRNPFDWLAIYCMRVEDDPDSMDGLNERLDRVLDALFAASQSDPEETQ